MLCPLKPQAGPAHTGMQTACAALVMLTVCAQVAVAVVGAAGHCASWQVMPPLTAWAAAPALSCSLQGPWQRRLQLLDLLVAGVARLLRGGGLHAAAGALRHESDCSSQCAAVGTVRAGKVELAKGASLRPDNKWCEQLGEQLGIVPPSPRKLTPIKSLLLPLELDCIKHVMHNDQHIKRIYGASSTVTQYSTGRWPWGSARFHWRLPVCACLFTQSALHANNALSKC